MSTETENHLEIPDYIDRVSFDVSLGKSIPKGKVLDVNYDAIRTTTSAMGVPSDAAPVAISIESLDRLDGGIGSYDAATDTEPPTVRVAYGGYKPVQRANRRLAHELNHFAEDVTGTAPPASGRYHKAWAEGNRLKRNTAIMALGGLAVASGVYLHLPELTALGGAANIYPLQSNIRAFMRWSYDPGERRAKKAAKVYGGSHMLELNNIVDGPGGKHSS